MRTYDRESIVVCVQVRPVTGRFGVPVTAKSQVEKYPVMDGTTVYGSQPSMTAFRVKYFTESLILAQDERWRRA
jgi:hypothetical protein